MRRLSNAQRQAVMKWGCLALAASMFIGLMFALPYVFLLIPNVTSADIRGALYGDSAKPYAAPTFALGSIKDEETDESENIGEYVPDEEESIPTPTPNDGDLNVTASNLCWYEIDEMPMLNIINRTSYKVDLNSYLERELPKHEKSDEPLVLVVHTHGSESYLPSGYNFYSPDETFRSLDEKKTVVHIGEVLCERLNEYGIKAIHDRTMYDQTDFNRSYNYSREGIKKALAEYPSIKYVIDLHRDSVFDAKGNNVKPLTNIDGKDCAQLMLVVGTNEAGAVHPNWRDNLTFATHLQQAMNDKYPTLARPINLRTSAFNQALTSGSVLLEVGSCGNTIEEAENAVTLFAEIYANLLGYE